MSKTNEWLGLVEVSGPFLSETVLQDVFPQGLDQLDTSLLRRIRTEYGKWRDAIDSNDEDVDIFHLMWIEAVLARALEFDLSVIRRPDDIPECSIVELPGGNHYIEPDYVVVDPAHNDEILCLIHEYGHDIDLDARRSFAGMTESPAERMKIHLRELDKPVGIVTNGERWMIVHAPKNRVPSFVSWYARLWSQEPETLRAFSALLGVRRFFAAENAQLPALYERSLAYQNEVTGALGEQVREAVDLLVQALDRADLDRGRDLMRDVEPATLYEAALTVMMRLVVLLAAEERGLLLLDEPLYNSYYAVSTLRAQLREESDEILERRRSAWIRILAVFRAVYGGVEHPTLRLPALGGSLFDPDRFPFLEGRPASTSWRSDTANPLPVDDLTVLRLLEAIQTFKGRTLSFKALDVEQIGFVYEGLLDRTVVRVTEVTLVLVGKGPSTNVDVPLADLESARSIGHNEMIAYLHEKTGLDTARIARLLGKAVDGAKIDKLLASCRNDENLRDQLKPYAALLVEDPWGYPRIYHEGALAVVSGTERQKTGAHYTPKDLTEKVVEDALNPVVYEGPAEGRPVAQWKLKSPSELLDLKICDPAMGSGAFLVQACRFVANRLEEAWERAEKNGGFVDIYGVVHDEKGGIEPLPVGGDTGVKEERIKQACRLVVERCLYGVDINPLAVELAKLSLWLLTLSKGRPFGFLDHTLRSGDSLLGIWSLDQLTKVSLEPGSQDQEYLFGGPIRNSIDEALTIRRQLRSTPIRDIRDVNLMENLDEAARIKLARATTFSDSFVGKIFVSSGKSEKSRKAEIDPLPGEFEIASGDESSHRLTDLRNCARDNLNFDSQDQRGKVPFHWPLEFPEVFAKDQCGFDACIGNPPFLGGRRISEVLGRAYNLYLNLSNPDSSGATDLSAHFFRRAWNLVRRDGTIGFIATNSIAQGPTRKGGLEYLAKGGATIYKAKTNVAWPGQAAVVTSIVHLCKGRWLGHKSLNGRNVGEVSSFLDEGRVAGKLLPLKENRKIAFMGSTPKAKGFLLDMDTAKQMLDASPKNADVIFPYLDGNDLNGCSRQRPSRFVINFWDWPEELAQEYELPFSWIQRRVYPEWVKDSAHKKKSARSYWWQHHRARSELYHAIGHGRRFEVHPKGWAECDEGLDQVLAVARTSKTLGFVFVGANAIYSDGIYVIASNRMKMFAVLQSNIHSAFAWQFGSRRGGGLLYTPQHVVEPFPFPPSGPKSSALEDVGRKHHEVRGAALIARDSGLTKFLGALHTMENSDPDLEEMRELIQLTDRAVADAYGWDDLDLEHGFHKLSYLANEEAPRYTISEAARVEVLNRLIMLNQERSKERRGG